jgi:MoaA/NifB/PqqE/SkfB family radical SAM enzyme
MDKPNKREENLRLNDSEYKEGKIALDSTPEGIGIGTHYRCNAKCVFCLGKKSDFFSLQRYKEFFEPRLAAVISNARFVNFCGFGELFLMPEIEKFLDYVNEKIPQANKIYTTNGTPLANGGVLSLLTKSKSAVEISLHASNSRLHKSLTDIDAFNAIESSIKKLLSMRKYKDHPSVSLVFLINALNIENLPDFVKFAASLGVDEVICSYMTVFEAAHLELSCFFKQEITNVNLHKAEELAKGLNLAIRLPPKFREDQRPAEVFRCSDPWKYCYIENEGSMLACCYAGSHFGYLAERDFAALWNGDDYRQLRRSLVDGLPHEWCQYCYRFRRENVNDIRSHINSRPGFRDEVLK